MLTVGDKVPNFSLTASILNKNQGSFESIRQDSYPGKWLILFFWPKDFTFVCPTEIAEFAALNNEFSSRKTQVLGISTDSEYVHLAWRDHHPAISQVPFPMLSDIKRELSTSLGVLDRSEGVSQRATFIIDPEGLIRFSMVTDLNVGRNPQEVLRVLDALQTKELTPCNWQQGQKTIVVA